MRTRGICKCGCGTRTKLNYTGKEYKIFAEGHYGKGRKMSQETKEKISKTSTGQKRTEETKRNISEALKRHQYDPERIKKN